MRGKGQKRGFLHGEFHGEKNQVIPNLRKVGEINGIQ